MKNPELSIVIITMNEENYLPNLLESIKKQKYKNYELIVSDAGSKDKTIEIAKKYKCKIVKGGIPAKGRNSGARAAKGNLILFLDADVILPENFLEDAVSEFKKQGIGAAGCYAIPENKTWQNRIIMAGYNLIIKIFQYTSAPITAGLCIFSKKDIHENIHGFDESIVYSEDIEYLKRIVRLTKFRILKKPRVCISMRRFEMEGSTRIIIKYIATYLYRTFFGKEFRGRKTEPKYFNYELNYKK